MTELEIRHFSEG